jgi:hypothetical protein
MRTSNDGAAAGGGGAVDPHPIAVKLQTPTTVTAPRIVATDDR